MNAESNIANRPRHTVALPGCHPVPLASYLKGLGLFRLVAEQADPDARCYWKNEQLVLETKLDHDELTDFLLNRYHPSPIMAPWGARSGFYSGSSEKSAREAINAIIQNTNARFSEFTTVYREIKNLLKKYGFSEKAKDKEKLKLLRICRNELPDYVLNWLDTCYVLTNDGRKFPPLVGTGGNEGSGSYVSGFTQMLVEVLINNPKSESIKTALFDKQSSEKMVSQTFGQFNPFGNGGPNSSTGFQSDPRCNGWDYILMMEGCLLFSSAVSNQLESAQEGWLSCPFTVRPTGAGFATESYTEEIGKFRAEIWLPIWNRPISKSELDALFSSGRATVGKRPAMNGLDFARAVSCLGVDRGVSEFQRLGIIERLGQNNIATPLDRLPVQRNRYVRLLEEIDPWLDRFRSRAASTNPEPPAGVASALRRLENSILRLCQTEEPARVQDVLCALGHCERTLARSLRWTRETAYLRPIHGLSVAWANAAKTDRPEYRLARSLASSTLLAAKNQLPFRYFLEPVNPWGNGWRDDHLRDTAWTEGGLASALNAIFHRQLLIAHNTPAKGETNHFAHRARKTAPLPDIAAFIENALDEALFSDLLWGLSLIDWSDRDEEVESAPPPRGPNPDALYGLLKLCFAGSSLRETAIPVVPAIHHRAAHGNAVEASKLACRRLRASGLAPAIEKLTASESHARRTAAALIFPISTQSIEHLDHQVLTAREESEPPKAAFDFSETSAEGA